MGTLSALQIAFVLGFQVTWSFLLNPQSSTTPRPQGYFNQHCAVGKEGGVIVHLFEWKWTDIKKECAFLAASGYCALQTSVPTESVIITQPVRPWWERYQPISFILKTRSGNESEFASMVRTCNRVGVRVYVDVVVNHMAHSGGMGHGMAGSLWDTRDGKVDLPAVPFNASNFHHLTREQCSAPWGTNLTQTRDCGLGLIDLNQRQPYVRAKIVEFFNHLFDIGVAGIRVDSAQAMWPQDLQAIMDATKDVKMGGRPFYILEDPNTIQHISPPSAYNHLAGVTEFRFAEAVGEIFRNRNLSAFQDIYDSDIGRELLPGSIIFVDNHDIQRGRERKGAYIVTHKTPVDYKMAQAFTLALGVGVTRVMSSYYFWDTEAGPPHDKDNKIVDVLSDPSDGSCMNGWVCEHRWPAIIAMTKFRNHVARAPVLNFNATKASVSFSRGNKGFFVMGDPFWWGTFHTNLPQGTYCDLISSCKLMVTVTSDGTATINKPYSASEAIVALINQ